MPQKIFTKHDKNRLYLAGNQIFLVWPLIWCNDWWSNPERTIWPKMGRFFLMFGRFFCVICDNLNTDFNTSSLADPLKKVNRYIFQEAMLVVHHSVYNTHMEWIILLILLLAGYPHNPYNGVVCNDTITATGVFSSKQLWRLAKGKGKLAFLSFVLE